MTIYYISDGIYPRIKGVTPDSINVHERASSAISCHSSRTFKVLFNGLRSHTPLHRDVAGLIRRVRHEQEPVWATGFVGDSPPSTGECAVASMLVTKTLARELGCRAAIGCGQVLFDNSNLTTIPWHWWGWVPTLDRGLVIADITLDQSGHSAPYVCNAPEALAAEGIHYGPGAH